MMEKNLEQKIKNTIIFVLLFSCIFGAIIMVYGIVNDSLLMPPLGLGIFMFSGYMLWEIGTK